MLIRASVQCVKSALYTIRGFYLKASFLGHILDIQFGLFNQLAKHTLFRLWFLRNGTDRTGILIYDSVTPALGVHM